MPKVWTPNEKYELRAFCSFWDEENDSSCCWQQVGSWVKISGHSPPLPLDLLLSASLTFSWAANAVQLPNPIISPPWGSQYLSHISNPTTTNSIKQDEEAILMPTAVEEEGRLACFCFFWGGNLLCWRPDCNHLFCLIFKDVFFWQMTL